MPGPRVVAVHRSSVHAFSKDAEEAIHLIEGLGVEGDAHAGKTVQHRSRVRRDPSQPNLRQVHLMHAELFAELMELGFTVWPGNLGENITTEGLDLLALPCGTQLRFDGGALVEITGLRNPCAQIDGFQPGLMQAVLDRDEAGNLVRKAGVMGIVLASGTVQPGAGIQVFLPVAPHQPLAPV